MKYYDENGVEITRKWWAKLYRTPGYGDPMSHQGANSLVRLHWLGLVSEHESRPCPWMVEVTPVDSEGKPLPGAQVFWAATRTEAEAVYAGMCEQLCGALAMRNGIAIHKQDRKPRS